MQWWADSVKTIRLCLEQKLILAGWACSWCSIVSKYSPPGLDHTRHNEHKTGLHIHISIPKMSICTDRVGRYLNTMAILPSFLWFNIMLQVLCLFPHTLQLWSSWIFTIWRFMFKNPLPLAEQDLKIQWEIHFFYFFKYWSKRWNFFFEL